MERIILVNTVRSYLNDYAVKNRLLGENEEYTDDDIFSASATALIEINTKGIVHFAYTTESCPDHLLLMGTLKHLLVSIISLKSRNTIVVSEAGGGSVNREGNLELYYRLYSDVRAQFDQDLYIAKAQANMEGAFDC